MNAKTTAPSPHISIAPMMDWTDRHCRYFHRLLSPNVRLYTEMVTTGALIHGDRARHLRFNDAEHPLALQLGGSEPDALAECAKMAEDYGYDEINLNCGCPSERVQKGAFGACLMSEPDLVARCMEAMAKTTNIPITVKCRIGIDDHDPAPFLRQFIKDVSSAGCMMFIIHARKAWLKGLSPKENREIPPLDYELPFEIKCERPDLKIILNGGVRTVDDTALLLQRFHGVMIGREAYQNPRFLSILETHIFKNTSPPDHRDVVMAMIPYMEQQMRDHGTPVKAMTRHMIGLFQGQRGSRAWRRALSETAHNADATPSSVLFNALAKLQDIGS